MRDVPGVFEERDRKSYMAIAERAKVEAVNLYTIVSLGAQSFCENNRLEERRLERPPEI